MFKIDELPNFQIRVANDQLETQLATVTLKFDFEDHTLAEQFVALKNLTGPVKGLHFMKHNCVVIDITQCLIHFPYLT